jgi:ribose-phosphate pyrophosphokinase
VILLYGFGVDAAFAQAVASNLSVPLASYELREFEDGECKLRPKSDPHGADVYVLCSLYADLQRSPHDKLFQLLMFIATLRDHGASRVTAGLPYLAYARKDRQTKPFDPLSLRYVAQLFESVGTQQVFALEAQNVAAFQNAFRIPTAHFSVHSAFDKVALELAGGGALAVASPDPGGVKRAQLWREALEVSLAQPIGFAMVDKRRSGGVLSSDNLVAGDVSGKAVLVLDDLISSGDTMLRAAHALRREGACKVVAFAAHGLFAGTAADTLAEKLFEKVVVSDSVTSFRLAPLAAVRAKLVVVGIAPMLAQAIANSNRTWKG